MYLGMAWKLCGRRAMTWITGIGFRISHLYCVHLCQLFKPTDNNRHKPYRTSLWRKVFCTLWSNFKSVLEKLNGFWGVTEMGEIWWRTRQPEYINFSGVLGMKSRPEAREDGWNCLACLHMKVSGRVLWYKKRKLFIGSIPSVFLWNVIITQAGHIYCIYRQHTRVEGAYYLSLFIQLNIWCKHENTMVKSAWFIKSGFLATSSVKISSNRSGKKGLLLQQ